MAAVADRVRRFDPIFADFADGLKDFTPFFPLEGLHWLVKDWARTDCSSSAMPPTR